MADMPNAERKSHIPRWAKVIGLLLVLVFVLLGTIRILGLAATRRWERYVAKLEAEGQPMTMEAINALRTPLPDEQNGALIIEEIADKLTELDPGPTFGLALGRQSPQADFFRGVPQRVVESNRTLLADRGDLLAHLEQLGDKPFGRFEIVLTGNPWEMLFPHLLPVRTACKLEHTSGIVKLTEGDLEGAARAATLQFHIAGTLNEHPSLIGRLLESACAAMGASTVEDTLRVGELSEKTLLHLESTIANHLDAVGIRWALQSERAFQSAICEMQATGRIPEQTNDVFGDVGPIPHSFVPDMLIRSNQLRGAEMVGRLVDAADDPQALVAAARRLDAESAKLPKTQFFIKTYIPSLTHACKFHVRIIALLRCTRGALAAERYRMEIGTLPDSLDVLVPQYLAEVPIDPFDGKPLRLVQSDEGIIIYSIGEDGIDDEGFVVEKETGRRGSDEGFRLNRLEHRGLILIHDRPPDEE